MNDDTSRISSVLAQVRLLKSKYDELAAVTGEDFNIFSILRIKRKEVITHTPMLAELLDPHGSHHQGAAFLKLFLETCVKQKEPGNVQQETAFYNKPESFRVRSEERPDQAQFDILLEKDKEACIVIENKIGAKDQISQLNRLYQDASKRFRDSQIRLIYLTLDGSLPSKESLKAKTGQVRDLSLDEVKLISYRKHIISWLEECMKLHEVQRITPIREILFQYRDLLKQLTGQSTNTRYSMDLTKLLTKDKNYKLIPDLEQALLELKVQTQLKFWEELADVIPTKIDKSSLHANQEKEASEDNIRRYYTGSRERLWYGTTFKLDSFSSRQPEIALRVELGIGGWVVFYGFILFEDGKRVKSCDNKKFNSHAEKLPEDDFTRNNWWLGWKSPKRGLGFPVEYLGAESKTHLSLLDDSERRKAVGELTTEIAGAVKQLKENLN